MNTMLKHQAQGGLAPSGFIVDQREGMFQTRANFPGCGVDGRGGFLFGG